jgi:hypothetical protein
VRALSVRQPWASLIATAGGKTVENRTWSTAHRGPLLICAGRRPDREAAAALIASGVLLPEDQPTGVTVCTVELVNVTRDHPSPWSIPGQWHWILTDPRPVDPFPLSGRLGLFEVALPGRARLP